MATLNFFPTNGVKIRRTNVTTNGVTADIDANVKEQLVYLNDLLSKPIYQKDENGDWTGPDGTFIQDFVTASLKTRRYGSRYKDEQQWEEGSLLSNIYRAINANSYLNNGSTVHYSLEEYIDAEDKLSLLKFDFSDRLMNNWNNLDINPRSILNYPGIVNYLLAMGYNAGYQEINGLTNFIFGNRSGNRNIISYAQVSAAREYIHAEKVDVEYNTDTAQIIQDILKNNPSFSSQSFYPFIQTTVANYVSNSKELDLLKLSKYYDDIPVAMIPRLIKMIKASVLPVTKTNIDTLLPIFMNDIENTPGWQDDTSDTDTTTSQGAPDFSVTFLDEDNAVVQILSDNIRCAAQMFYSMTLGDELDVFNVVNFFTHKYMVRGNIQISDQQLREDLQLYVFSNKFTNPKTGKIVDRTRPAERMMFYKQVFNYGNAPVTEDVVVNKEFPKYWRILIMEVAKYIQKAQDSPNPDSYVSRQTVMQAVEDLQYNLSTHCSGMANVISPIIYDELYFVIKRILSHPEIVKQLVPAGGNWWKVVELLYEGMKHQRPKTTILYNKAKLGYAILNSIADYNPVTFEDDTRFSTFISNVDAFIISQAQLQNRDDDDDTSTKDDPDHKRIKGRDRDRDTDSDDKAPDKATAPAGKDEWDF
ncbi:hypothetical protein FHW36_10227 [Chitinophaga polysaccharea]|uniref:Uncharacterized protein n=1 Tax=Chitinophaga polysaccharea TaxID=1293035 RepID=A0A561PVZ3_9BACT|nr:hypothetical protein [Chitinophaga polysaccharea]TWF42272.1 hypothetical protein FHW36_10227 [Chitinophaga polysaccharea]